MPVTVSGSVRARGITHENDVQLRPVDAELRYYSVSCELYRFQLVCYKPSAT